MMKSSLTFHPTDWVANRVTAATVSSFFTSVRDLALESEIETKVTMQHSLREDRFALMVECGNKTLASHGVNPVKVFDSVLIQVLKYRRKLREQKQKEESATGAPSSKRHRRKGPARVRRTSLLQKRRS